MYVGSGYRLTKHDCGDCSVAVYSRNLDAPDESGVDPNFFDTGYTLAASTGLAKVWDGTWPLLRILQSSVGKRMRSKRVLELGSGTGLAGLYAANQGFHVLLTDVAAVVELLRHNIAVNARVCAPEVAAFDLGAPQGVPPQGSDAACGSETAGRSAVTDGDSCNAVQHEGGQGAAPRACESDAAARLGDRAPPDMQQSVVKHDAGGAARCCAARDTAAHASWPEGTAVGDGTAAALPLDWEECALTQQWPRIAASADYVIACEVIWLADLIEPYVRTLAAVLHSPQRPVCLMTYTHRGTATSRTFARAEDVLRCMREHLCEIEDLPEFEGSTDDGERVSAWRVTGNRPVT